MTKEQVSQTVLRVLTNHNQSSLLGLKQIVDVDIELLKEVVEELILSQDICMTKTTFNNQGYYVYKLNRKKKR